MESEENISSQKSQPVHTSEISNAVKNEESRLNNIFQDTVAMTVDKFLQYVNLKSFKETYPEIYQGNKTHLKEIHNQFRIQLKDSFLDEAKEICNTSDIHTSLHSLDSLITKHEDIIEKESWRPTRVPSKDLRDHLHQVKLRQKKCLEFQLQTLITENESVERIIQEKYQKILNIKSSHDHLNQDLLKYFEVIEDGSIERLEEESTLIY